MFTVDGHFAFIVVECLQLKDIEKFMRDHGSQLNLDVGTGELEGKVESIIGELRNVLKEAIPEGGKGRMLPSKRKAWCMCVCYRNGNVSKLGDELDSTRPGR